jgi:ectoine hydroxylase-related dioxygenase (phytanoyl-CoA dioxygenase family)
MTMMRVAAELESLRRDYARDGFVAVRGLIAADELADYAVAVDAAVATRKARDARTLAEKSRYEQSFLQCQYIWEDFPGVRPLTFHPAICAMAALLIGADRLRLWHDQALYKEPGGAPTQAHQDHPYWPIAEHRTVTAWIPLVVADDSTGCMGYVPGSHREAPRFVDIFTGAGDADGAAVDAARFVPAVPGDVIFHHGLTLHMAMGNRSEMMRRVYTGIYFADGCTRTTDDKGHPSVDRSGIAPGAPIDGAATPLAWPLAHGDYPDPAPWPHRGDARLQRVRELGIVPGGG